jgi:hypothetical protein
MGGMLDRTIAEPVQRSTDLVFAEARVVIRVEPKDGPAVEVEIAEAFGGVLSVNGMDMELRDANRPPDPPIKSYITRREVRLTVSGEASVRLTTEDR